MPQQIINIGTVAGDGTGDALRESQRKTNENFSEIYTRYAPNLGVVTPTDTPTGTGINYWECIEAGTYTNFGGVVLAANSRGTIFRNLSGVFSISQVAYDITSKVNVSDVIDNLTSTEVSKPLSAKQGKTLQDTKVNVSDVVNNLTSTETARPLSAAQGKILNDNKADKTALIDKADLVVGKNKFDKSKAIIGSYKNELNVAVVSATYDYSDLIPVVPSTQYVANNSMRFINFYDVNETFISGASLQTLTTFTSPSSAYFTVITINHTTLNAFQLEIGTVSSVYESYKKIVKQEQLELREYVKFTNISNNLNSSSTTDALSLAGAKELNDKMLSKSELNSKIFNINAYAPNLVHQYYDDSAIARKASSTITYTGTTYYVDSSKADDTGNGLTALTAKKTITAAYNLAANGSIIQLANGTYNLANESGAYLLLNTNSKGVLIRGNLTDNTLVTLNQTTGTYGVRFRDCGNMRIESLTISVSSAINGVYADFNAAYNNRDQVFYNVKFIVNGTGYAYNLSGKTALSTDAYFIEFDSCLFELVNQTVSYGVFAFVGSSSYIEVLMKNNIYNIANMSAIYNPYGKAKLYAYDNIFNISGNVVAVGYGLDGYAPNTIPLFDFIGNKIIYAAGYMQHALLLGGGLMAGNVLNNYIYMDSNSNSLALGIVIKPMAVTLGDFKIYGNYVKAPRPFYIKGGAKNDIKYNSSICNYTGRAPFEYVNFLDVSTDRLSENNNIECNNFVGIENAIIIYDGGTAQSEDVTIKTCVFKDNRYYFATNYINNGLENYTWGNRNTFWTVANEIDSVKLQDFHIPIRVF